MNAMADKERMLFVLNRDGHDDFVRFVDQCVVVYRRAALAGKRKYNHGFHYRRAYIESYLYHKRVGQTED